MPKKYAKICLDFHLAVNTYLCICFGHGKQNSSICRTKICILDSFAIHVHIGHLDMNYGRPVRRLFSTCPKCIFQFITENTTDLVLFCQSTSLRLVSSCFIIDRQQGMLWVVWPNEPDQLDLTQPEFGF